MDYLCVVSWELSTETTYIAELMIKSSFIFLRHRTVHCNVMSTGF